MCNDRELSRIEKSKTCLNFQYMRSVALPNLPLSSPVLIQEDQLEYQNITKTPYLTILTFIDITGRFEYYKTRIYRQFRSISLSNRINKYKLILLNMN